MKIKKLWGYELVVANNELYCGKLLHLKKRFMCSIHYHKKKDETFHILKGKVLLQKGKKPDNLEDIIMAKGSSLRIKPNTYHRFIGITSSTILEISTTDESDDSYRYIKSAKITNDQFLGFKKIVEEYEKKDEVPDASE